MRGGDFFIHVETIRENTPKGWIMNPNYSEILRFHDFGDMLLKINTVLSYLENSRQELPNCRSFIPCRIPDLGKRQRAFIFCRYSAHSITAGRGSSGVRTEGRGILEVRWKLCA